MAATTDERDPGDLGGRAVRGASVVVLGQGVRVVATLVATVVLARLLSPADFGLMAIVISLVALGEVLRDFGLTTAAARAWDITPHQKSNLFWINTGVGLLLAGVLAAAAPMIAAVFGQADLFWMTLLIAPTLAVAGATAQFRAEINRRLRFGALAIVDTVPVAVGVVTGIVWAFYDPSPLALVAQQIAVSVVGLLLAVPIARWWPGMPRRAAGMRALLNYGGGLFGTQLTAYFARNADNLAIGYVWGPGALGIYSRAFQLLMMPINQLSAPLTRVAVPILSRLVDERARFEAYLISSQRLNTLVLGVPFAVSVGIAVPLVAVIFGPQWSAMVPIFQALAVGGIFKALNQVSFWAFLATGRTGAQFRLYLFTQPVIVIMMLAGLPWGPFGVAVGHSVGYAFAWGITLWWCGRVTGMPAPHLILQAGKNIVFLLLPVGAASWLVSALFDNVFAAIAAGVVSSIMVAAASAAVFPSSRATIAEVIRVVRKVRKRP